ncbi:hypothetical protein E4U17_004186 [Claviceps sp. LM77 group G4]|nr:hypothetical protein E4U17_004186 [Claviceps sp. LM77 group G4]KAG6074227.1 hypothetical protein E4U16_004120 [Claviceps sp. LM84 group G4]KAG6081050.1 hypothetical protein E4U33_007116 [Claviceps sp. LM78 group G4]
MQITPNPVVQQPTLSGNVTKHGKAIQDKSQTEGGLVPFSRDNGAVGRGGPVGWGLHRAVNHGTKDILRNFQDTATAAHA